MSRARLVITAVVVEERCQARRGTYRGIYRIDQEQRRVTVGGVVPRSDAYR